MKTHAIIRTLAVTLILGAFAAGGLFAQGGNGKKGEGKGKKMEQALAELNLTDAQKAEIDRLQEAFQTENEGALNEIKTLRETMKTQRQNGDAEGAKATMEQIKAKRSGLKESRKGLQSRIMEVLTDEQKAQLQQMKKEHGGKGKKGKKGGKKKS